MTTPTPNPTVAPTVEQIRMSKGMFAVVDIEDFECLSKYHWYLSPDGYAIRSVSDKSKKSGTRIVFMHREIMGMTPGDGKEVDHIDLDKLNNTRSNLRVCTKAENRRNRGKRSDNKSGFKGVHRCKNWGNWRASIRAEGKYYALGTYDTPEEAYAAYCAAAYRLHGEFARVSADTARTPLTMQGELPGSEGV